MNALGDERVVAFLKENCVATYVKVGTFSIVNGQKIGGNVASYFCLPNGGVLHALAGPLGAEAFLTEARWIMNVYNGALLDAGLKGDRNQLDGQRFLDWLARAHSQRQFTAVLPGVAWNDTHRQRQIHGLLAHDPLMRLDRLYPIVWRQILGEQLSSAPVVR